ncbi:hypothetical protein BV20DRAFT_972202 [Pilatotrama ljubarskyi]|nr:hypothetical protein BV20DRAFT_972202 [Pilatotrama ljubarskyi]
MAGLTHRALHVEEILATIVRHLTPYVWDRREVLSVPDGLDVGPVKDLSLLGVDDLPSLDNQRALVQCARVSRAFSLHALKVLWRTLPDLRPLQRLLDSMGFSYADLNEGTPVHTLPIGFEPSSQVREWRRYRWYASCVTGVRSVINCNALEEWSDRGGPPVLPRLQSARFQLDPRSINRSLRLLNSCMRDLTLDFDSANSSAGGTSRWNSADVLDAVARSAPGMEVLNVTFRAPPQDVSPVIPHLVHLRVLVVTGWMTPSLHATIENLKHLEHLYVKLYWTRHAEASSLRNLQRRRCFSVKTLVALSLTEPFVLSLQVIDFPALEHTRLEVWPHSSDATEGLTQIMQTLCNSAPKLRSLVLTTRSAAAYGDRPPSRLLTVIEPLLQHRVLETLSLTLQENYAFALTREDILSFASAWPNIVTLNVAHAPTPSRDALPPVMSFLELVRACPRLETLVLCARFDCSARRTWRDTTIAPHPLRGLFLGLDPETGSYRPDKTWHALAAILDRCFPSLDAELDLVLAEVVGTKTVETWNSVLQHLQEIRAGERRSMSPLGP